MKTLPIDYKIKKIIDVIEKNPITIIAGSTGCGKSSRIPFFLAEKGYKVLVTQPRTLSAVSLAKSVARLYGDKKCGNRVGYQTSFKSCYSKDSQIIFLTETTELICQLADAETLENTILILDEFHERSIEVDLLLGFVKKLIEDGKNLKLLIMSATLESNELSKFLHDAPIIKIPSNYHDVDFIHRKASDIEEIIYAEAKMNKNILVFLPGKKEILDLRKKLQEHFNSYGIDAKILVLHSELSQKEQQLVFHHYEVPKIILATEIAQTSITITDLDIIIDSGLVRKEELIDGVPCLITKQISISDCLQRKGRVGRCTCGKYYLCSDFKYEHRSMFSTPEIFTPTLERVLLTLIKYDIDINSLDLLHTPNYKNIEYSMKLLKNLGALTDKNEITEIGVKMTKFPLDCRSSRMMVEAKKYGVEFDVLICCLLMQIGTIQGQNKDTKEVSVNSDLIYELELFKSVYNSRTARNSENYPYIHLNNFKKISTYIGKILPKSKSIVTTESADVDKIKKCLLSAYHDCLFMHSEDGGFLNKSYFMPRFPYSTSVVYNKRCNFLIGCPLDFSDGKNSIYRRILFPTELTLDELLQFEDKLFSSSYSLKNDEVYKTLYYNDIGIVSSLVGSISDLKESDPSGFYEKEEYNPKFKQKYISLYYKNLKISSKSV